MPLSATPTTVALAFLALGVASGARAQERCTGTLCDAYYGGAAPTPTAPAGATPMTVPSGGILGFFTGSKPEPAAPAGAPGAAPPPAKAPLVGVEGGGLLGMMKGTQPERCSGTICDLFYGGPPPDRAEPQRAVTRDAQGIDRGIDRGADIDRSPPRARNRRAEADEGVSYAPRQVERPQCVAPPGDPWRCYRK